MKILVGEQIAQADRLTVEKEGIELLDLMERAGDRLSQRLCEMFPSEKDFCFVIGKGNNGGDGLVMARLMSQRGLCCKIFVPRYEGEPSNEMLENLKRLPAEVGQVCSLGALSSDCIVVDALLGSGMKGKVRDYYRSVICELNALPNKVIAIDVPSGMCGEWNDCTADIVSAEVSLTIQFPKLAMMLSEAGAHCGKIEIIDIDLDCSQANSPYSYTCEEDIQKITFKPNKFAYKNQNGHTMLICGCREMMGAAVLATSAALRSGVGLVTCHTPYEQRFALQCSCPSAMLSYDVCDYWSIVPKDLPKYSSIMIGPGLGTHDASVKAMRVLLEQTQIPMVIDADALNILAENKDMLQIVPQGSILTPHLGELRRIIQWSGSEELLSKTVELAAETGCYIIIKGAHSAIVSPNGEIAFNSSGCSAMAKGGSGDILAGLLAGLLARGYAPFDAAKIAVYHHGKAGEAAAQRYGAASTNSLDIVNELRL